MVWFVEESAGAGSDGVEDWYECCQLGMEGAFLAISSPAMSICAHPETGYYQALFVVEMVAEQRVDCCIHIPVFSLGRGEMHKASRAFESTTQIVGIKQGIAYFIQKLTFVKKRAR